MLSGVKRGVGRGLEGGVIFLMAALAIVVLLGITFRALGSALSWYDETASILLAWLTYFGSALAALRRAHIGVPNVIAALPREWRIAAFVLAEAMVFAFFALAGWTGWVVIDVMRGSYLASLPSVSVSLVQSIIPLGAALFILAEALSLPDAWRATVGRGRAATAHGAAADAATE